MSKCILIISLFLPAMLAAQLQVATIFSDNMVLQRAQLIPVWGTGTPGDMVQVHFLNDKKSAIIASDSSWRLFLKKQKANTTPVSMMISSGREKIVLNNILIGDVWIASGQSNMEWPMNRELHWKEESKNAAQPLIRFNNPPPAGRYVYGVAYNDSLNRRLTTDSFYLWSQWQNCDSQSLPDMSAVGYYFAKTIAEKKQVPIGIINLSIGGAPIETFISREALQNSDQFAKKLHGNWLENPHLPVWIRQRAKENVGAHLSGFGDALGLNHAYKPGFAFECGIQMLIPFAIKGLIWYQGESNALEKERVEEYSDLMHLMINDYRRRWQNSQISFY